MLKKCIKVIHLTIICIAITLPVLAQGGPPIATPIDGGLSWLLAAGGVYGLKKLIDMKKNQNL